MDIRDDLKDLQPGDRCILRWVRTARIGTIEKRSPGGRFTVNSGGAEYVFNARGRLVGATGWDSPGLHPFNEEAGQRIEEAAERATLAERFRHVVRWSELPLETLRSVAAVLDVGPRTGER